MKPLLSVGGNQENYMAAVERCGAQAQAFYLPEVSTDYDGLILCGGSDIHPKHFGQEINGAVKIDERRDQTELALLDAFVKAGKPVLGICRGCQVMNVYFGGTLIQHLAQTPMHRSDKSGVDCIHAVTAVEGSILHRLYGARFTVNSSHHQAVGVVGKELCAIATADGVIEAIQHNRLPILGVQWHPERMSGALRREDTVDGIHIFEHFLQWCKDRSKDDRGKTEIDEQ